MPTPCPHCGSTDLLVDISVTIADEARPIALSWTETVDTPLARVANLGKVGHRLRSRPLKAEICAVCKTVARLYISDNLDGIENREAQ